MGWSAGTGRSHVARLSREGWIDRVSRPLGKGSLFFATKLGIRVAGVDVPPAPPPAPIWWDHHDASAWVAAWLTVRGRELVGPRELIADELAGRGTGFPRRAAARPHPGPRRHRSRSPPSRDRGRARAQVQGAPASDLGLHARWIASGKTGACVYICGNEDVHKLVIAQAQQAGLRTSDGSLRVEMLEAIKDLVLKREQHRSTWNAGGAGRIVTPASLLIDVSAILALGTLGALCAWMMRRYSTLSVRNVYAPAAITAAVLVAVLAMHAWTPAMVLAPPTAFFVCAALCGRRLRLADLGAGEELRSFEQSRRWAWQPRPPRRRGERVYLRSQGELVHKRPWPAGVPYAPMSSVDHDSLRLPLGEGQHIFACGATGSGKTTTMRRVLAARTLTQKAALLILDQKGDEEDVEQMSRLAAAADVPFVLIDPSHPGSDRYQPLWGTPAQVAARAVEPIKQSEPYYYDVLRLHLDTVCRCCTQPTSGRHRSRS